VHHFLDELRSGRPLLQALGGLVTALFADGSGKAAIVAEFGKWAHVLPLLGAACPEAKVIHFVTDGRDIACSSWSAQQSGSILPVIHKVSAWTEAVEVAVSWGMANPDRYMEVRCEDMARRPRRELSQVLSWLGAQASSEVVAEALLRERPHEALRRRKPDGDQEEPFSPRLCRALGVGRFNSALRHFGYGTGNASSASTCPRQEEEEEEEPPLWLGDKLASSASICPRQEEEETLLRLDSELAAGQNGKAPCDQPQPEFANGKVTEHFALKKSATTPAALDLQAPPHKLHYGSNSHSPASTAAFGTTCSEELASILARRLERAERNNGP